MIRRNTGRDLAYPLSSAFFKTESMRTFLYDLAFDLNQSTRPLENLVVVFPNRRAILYFRKHLGSLLDKPVFSPKMVTIEDFISGYSPLKVPDKLDLIHELYLTYNQVVSSDTIKEAFDKFYFWGDMLLRDFDEADKYLVQAGHLFKDLSYQKELDSSFDYLTDEQREFLQTFWSGFEATLTENKRKFLSVWSRLSKLYDEFRKRLREKGLAYEGMMQREIAENIHTLSRDASDREKVVFAGFNALTKAEERIISYFVDKRDADVYWDMDEYYVNNSSQEAGKFFREYQRHEILGKTFNRPVPSNLTLKDGRRKVRIFGAAEPVSQAKTMAQILQDELQKGINPEETLIVLPDEKLLIPVLHGLSGIIDKLNVTMGFPLSGSPAFTLVELLVEMQIARRRDHFNHKHVLALLGHPYIVAADPAVANSKRKEILTHNWVHIPKNFLATSTEIHRLIFKEANQDVLSYLKEALTQSGSLSTISDLDREFIFNLIRLLNRMEVIVGGENNAGHTNLKSFLRLLRQLVKTHKIPFTGEPLRGLQIMGVLETRNLDYKNVFMLSLNEGAIPSSSGKGSYIPFNIRRAYGLPTVEHQDAMYAYLFYRVLQRAENVFLFYNSETDVLGQGEMSRFLQQLIYESGLEIERKVLHNPIQPRNINPIVIEKKPGVLDALFKLNEGNAYFKGLSPSALNTYIECRLKFYLRYIAKIREADEVEEDLDARVLGNFLHRVMELFYTGLNAKKGSKLIEASDLQSTGPIIERLIDTVFIETYRLDPSQPVVYEGQRLVVKEVVKRFAHRIVEMDRAYAPFTMEATEQGGLLHTIPLKSQNHRVILNGKIDRIDRKGNVLRVIDYKTGKDQLDFENIPSLFSRDNKRNKAAFQTLLYALLYKSNSKGETSRIVPGLINRMNLFDKEFQFGLKYGNTYVDDVDPLLPEFELLLTEVLDELFSPEIPFDQTTNLDTCKFCPYQAICYR